VVVGEPLAGGAALDVPPLGLGAAEPEPEADGEEDGLPADGEGLPDACGDDLQPAARPSTNPALANTSTAVRGPDKGRRPLVTVRTTLMSSQTRQGPARFPNRLDGHAPTRNNYTPSPWSSIGVESLSVLTSIRRVACSAAIRWSMAAISSVSAARPVHVVRRPSGVKQGISLVTSAR